MCCEREPSQHGHSGSLLESPCDRPRSHRTDGQTLSFQLADSSSCQIANFLCQIRIPPSGENYIWRPPLPSPAAADTSGPSHGQQGPHLTHVYTVVVCGKAHHRAKSSSRIAGITRPQLVRRGKGQNGRRSSLDVASMAARPVLPDLLSPPASQLPLRHRFRVLAGSAFVVSTARATRRHGPGRGVSSCGDTHGVCCVCKDCSALWTPNFLSGLSHTCSATWCSQPFVQPTRCSAPRGSNAIRRCAFSADAGEFGNASAHTKARCLVAPFLCPCRARAHGPPPLD